MDKAEIVFYKQAGLGTAIRAGYRYMKSAIGIGKKYVQKSTKKNVSLKPIGQKTTPRQQMMREYQKNYKTWTGGKRPVSVLNKEELARRVVSDRYKSQF